jgi:hypothetical protein
LFRWREIDPVRQVGEAKEKKKKKGRGGKKQWPAIPWEFLIGFVRNDNVNVNDTRYRVRSERENEACRNESLPTHDHQGIVKHYQKSKLVLKPLGKL